MTPAPTDADSRVRAIQILIQVDDQGLGSQTALRAGLDREPPLHGPDRALVTELVYGVLRRRRPLDIWIGGSAARGLAQMEPAVLAALRTGAYQLAFLPRIPTFAAVHATVEAAKATVPPRQIGFVHAVLRNLARRHAAGDGPTGEDLPAWIVQRLRDFAERIGQDPEAMLDAYHGQAPLHVHAVDGDSRLGAVLDAVGVPITPLASADVPAVWATEGGALFHSELFAARRVLAQDAGSAAVVEWLGAQPGMRVADVGAGRGAKSLCLTSRGARVTAIDVSAAKLVEAANLCRQTGHPLEATLVADASVAIALPEASFDAVLIDAPCTGLGTLRRRPEVRHRRKAADLLRMADLQRRILEHGSRLCRPGGVLVFATCSFAYEEGPLATEDFLRDHPEFHRDPGDAAWLGPLLDGQGDLRSHPLLDGMDTFQAARLRRAS